MQCKGSVGTNYTNPVYADMNLSVQNDLPSFDCFRFRTQTNRVQCYLLSNGPYPSSRRRDSAYCPTTTKARGDAIARAWNTRDRALPIEASFQSASLTSESPGDQREESPCRTEDLSFSRRHTLLQFLEETAKNNQIAFINDLRNINS